MERLLNPLKIIVLSLISILLIVIIINNVIPNNNKTYMNWCRSDYSGYNAPPKKWMIKCVNTYKKIEKEVRK